jgi:hypothetical protein
MNTLSKSLILVLVGTTGVLAGHYFGPRDLGEPMAVSAMLPGPEPVTQPAQPEASGNQAAELAALRAEIKALQAQVAREAAAKSEPARSEKTRRAEKARIFETQLMEAENKFREEPVDPAASRQSSEAVSRLLDKYPALSAQGAEVECRSASCRLSLPAGAEATLAAFIDEAQADFGQIDVFPGSAGAGGQTVLHLAPGNPPDPDLDPGLQSKSSMVITHGG